MELRRPEELETPEARKKFCESLQKEIRAAKKHFEKDFDRMVEDMEVSWRGAPKSWPDDAYVVNITQRFIRQKVASLYAKNPRAQAKKRPMLMFQAWDESPEMLEQAMVQAQMAAEQGRPPDPAAAMVLQEVQQAKTHDLMLTRLGKTLESLFHYYTNEQVPSFKQQMKSCVRAAVQTAVGYVRLGFQRETDLSQDNKAKIADHHQRLRHIEALQARISDDKNALDELSAEAEELRLAIEAIRREPMVVTREGMVFDFPLSTSIIPDSKCTQLKGWIGADWLTEERFMTPGEIREFYGVELGEDEDGNAIYNRYSTRGKAYGRNPRTDLRRGRQDMGCVWFMWHKPTGMKYTILDGFEDFLEEPDLPEVNVENFFPIYPLVFNEVIHPNRLFPPSDVRIMLPQQEEFNRSREGLREHRIANRPGYAAAGGMLDEEEKSRISSHDAMEVVELEGLSPGQKIADLIQELPKQSIDPNLYETGGVMGDIQMSVGAQEATFGSTSGATATEASIAEQNRTSALESEIDELNDFLSQLARDAGQVMLQELDQQTVISICGPGAVWPQLNREQIMQEISLEIVAGSNGRPNRAMRQQAMQQLVPFLIQIPGVNPMWLARLMVESIDDSIDLTEAIEANVPSIMSMNQQTQASGGNPEENPNQQGGQGGSNAPKPPAAEGDSRRPGRPPLQFPVVAGGETRPGVESS